MSKTNMVLVDLQGATIVALLLLVPLILSGCSEPATIATQPTRIATETSSPTSIPTETSAPTESPTELPPTDTPPPTEEPTPEVADNTACIACHTDETTLRAVAEEEEPAESLSEGEG